MTALHMLSYITLLVFSAAVLARIVRIMKMPVHLRWELYPVPHEKGRAHYGGSILEEVNWWTKPREMDRLNELRVMLTEIIFLKGVWEHNRSLWLASFGLHFGLYLLCGVLALLLLSVVLTLTGLSSLPATLALVIPLLAWGGYALGILGTVLLYVKRLTDPKLKMYNNPSHYFNLLLLGAIFITGLAWLATRPDYSTSSADFLQSLLTPAIAAPLPMIGYWHLCLVLFFFLYFPFTHMTHAFVKYFTYHAIRWEDEPVHPGAKFQTQLHQQIQQPVTWAAPHVNADGKKTWADLASETGEEKKS